MRLDVSEITSHCGYRGERERVTVLYASPRSDAACNKCKKKKRSLLAFSLQYCPLSLKLSSVAKIMFTQLTFSVPDKKGSTAYEFQNHALEVWEKLKAPTGKKSEFIRLCKKDRIKFDSAFNYIKKRGNIRVPWRYFLWIIDNG